MDNDKKQVRVVARNIRNSLKDFGQHAKIKDIVEIICDENLDNTERLMDLVSNDARVNVIPSVNRRKAIETFMVRNWDEIRDDEAVKTALLNSYCMGRISKEKRQEMERELIERCSVAHE